jgi:hypothetical protein
MAYTLRIPPPVSHSTIRSEECADLGRARLPPFSCQLERARANDLIYSLQGLELLVTVLLARNRQPPPTVAAGAPHAELATELLTLPSGLLAMVCEAVVKLKARLGAALRVRGGAWAYAGSIAGSYRAGYFSGIRYGPRPPRFPQYGAVASKLATKHTAGQCLKCLRVPFFSLSGGAQNCAIQ